ncbi:probable serine/threonine-protein kinase PBL11 isoform X1 [Lycium barbarum]|uniref:probable serine/threonine-protein kinase PBL11 isoform X1 n=1 Tax=Lycium barbarum TaxID=112863 RepID=UPI00293EB251|nr:probable serine/threonine-protein kinase PBL11 isoform X1 [Lycium barbarum]
MEQRLETVEKMRRILKDPGCIHGYYFQEQNYIDSQRKGCYEMAESFKESCSRLIEYWAINDDNIPWKMTPTILGNVKSYNFEELKDMTKNSNVPIGYTMHGRLYKGSILDDNDGGTEEVIIKTWDFLYPMGHSRVYCDHPSRFCNELEILTDENRHPCLMKLKGFCFQKTLAVVYDERPTRENGRPLRFLLNDILYSHMDNSFEFRDRIKVAGQLASLIAWLHEKQFTFREIRPSGIVSDEEFNIKVFDFNFLARASEMGKVQRLYAVGFDSPEFGGSQPLEADVYMFGILLVELFIDVNEEIPPPHYHWIQGQLQSGRKSIVDKTLLRDEDDELFANRITTIAADCLDKDPTTRVAMKYVSDQLSDLMVEAAKERGTKRKIEELS